MKKFLVIVAVSLLFIFSLFIFWAGLSPKSFFEFFIMYPTINKAFNQIGIIKYADNNILPVNSSEPVWGLTGQIIINDNTWNVEIANNIKDQSSGLSNRKTLYGNRGMLFVFPKMAKQSFWMKDMFIPIDMIFFDSDWRIVLIESNIQINTFPKTFGGEVKSQYVLEINAEEASWYGLKVGDQAIFLNK